MERLRAGLWGGEDDAVLIVLTCRNYLMALLILAVPLSGPSRPSDAWVHSEPSCVSAMRYHTTTTALGLRVPDAKGPTSRLGVFVSFDGCRIFLFRTQFLSLLLSLLRPRFLADHPSNTTVPDNTDGIHLKTIPPPAKSRKRKGRIPILSRCSPREHGHILRALSFSSSPPVLLGETQTKSPMIGRTPPTPCSKRDIV